MQPQPAVLDRELEANAVFGRTAAGLQKRPVDLFDVDAAVLDGFGRVGDLDQLAGGFLGISEGSIGGVFIRSFHLAGGAKPRYFAGRCELLTSDAPGWAL